MESFQALRWLMTSIRGVSPFGLAAIAFVLLSSAVIFTVVKPARSIVTDTFRDLSVPRVVRDKLPETTFIEKVDRKSVPLR